MSRSGSKLGVLAVIAAFALSPLAPRWAARRLTRRLSRGHEDARIAAYMALVRIGPRAAPAVIAHARSHGPTPGLMQLLGDLGDPAAAAALEDFAADADPEVAKAARESLQVLSKSD